MVAIGERLARASAGSIVGRTRANKTSDNRAADFLRGSYCGAMSTLRRSMYPHPTPERLRDLQGKDALAALLKAANVAGIPCP
jgi:dihydroorotate dehydrogenase